MRAKEPQGIERRGARTAEGMTVVIFFAVWLLMTAYLFGQWQRYEPTRAPIDFIAAIFTFPLAAAMMAAI